MDPSGHLFYKQSKQQILIPSPEVTVRSKVPTGTCTDLRLNLDYNIPSNSIPTLQGCGQQDQGLHNNSSLREGLSINRTPEMRNNPLQEASVLIFFKGNKNALKLPQSFLAS